MCQQSAATLGFNIPDDLHFSDHAVSGTKLARDGLQQMLAAAESGKFKTLFFYSLSRLGRESAITVPILKRLVYTYGIRFLSVSEGIDSAQENWELITAILNVYHEQYIRQLSADVRRGQIGTVLHNFSVGDYRFGYKSVPSPGGEVAGRGRNARPKMIYVIDEDQAIWVRMIFHRYVVDGRSASSIAKELSLARAPKDHRSTTKGWHVYEVLSVLRSSKYIGVWNWGLMKTVRDPMDGRTWQEPRDKVETQSWLRLFPQLKIVSEEIYEQAQRILQARSAKCASRRDEEGKLRGRIVGGGLRHMLEGLIVCSQCGADFHTCGSGARYMGCSQAKGGNCTNHTTLPRTLAERMILDRIGQQITANAEWKQSVIDETISGYQALQSQQPDDEARILTRIDELDRGKKRLLDLLESGETDPDVLQRLEERRTEKSSLERQLSVIRSRRVAPPSLPTPTWIDSQLGRLADALRLSDSAAWMALRQLIVGQILATPIIESGKKRGFIRVTLSLRMGQLIVDEGSLPKIDAVVTEDREMAREISIDIRERSNTEEQEILAWELYEQKKLMIEIKSQLGVSKARATAIIKSAADRRGVEIPDGRSRRTKLETKALVPSISQQKADEIMGLFHQHHLIADIANQVGLDRNTLTGVIRRWYEERGLPTPDGRTRRKSLQVKSSVRESKSLE